MARWLIQTLIDLRLRLQVVLSQEAHARVLLWAAVIGIAGGLSAALFREINFGLKWLFTGLTDDIALIAGSLDERQRLLIPTLGGLIAGICLWLGGKFFQKAGPLEYLEVIRLGDGTIKTGPALARLASSLFSISSGASIGREGGMVQLSSLAASLIGQASKLPRQRLRLMVACGAAAGMAAAYNTPLGGAIFIAEIVLQSLAIESLGPLIVASVSATLVIRQWIGLAPIFDPPDFNAVMQMGVGPSLKIGLLCGLAAPFFMALIGVSKALVTKLKLPLPLRLALGGLIVGVISLKVPGVWGNGHTAIEQLFHENSTWSVVLIFLIAKVLATLGSVGTGTVGGVFTTTLMMGASLGWLYSQTYTGLFQVEASDPISCIMLGMGAMLAATTHAPLAAIVMVFEMTLDANILFPLILSCLTARYLSGFIHEPGIYAHSVGGKPVEDAFQLRAGDLMAPARKPLDQNATALEATKAFCLGTSQHLWVTDASGTYLGAIGLEVLQQFEDFPRLDAINAFMVFSIEDFPAIQQNDSLTQTLHALLKSGAACLPVLSHEGKLIGQISKSDVLLALT